MRVCLLRLRGVSIFEQLQLEEALLRADRRNWCIVNYNAAPAIVMGISGKAEELLAVDPVNSSVPIIRRFSGGGCVVVDPATFFVTMICNVEGDRPSAFPQDVARWNAELYRPFLEHLDFRLCENDYVLGARKFGGNAQYLTKDRWLHHSTLLWDYDSRLMNLLKMPEKRPKYREERCHDDFLCRLSEHFSSLGNFYDVFIQNLREKFNVIEINCEEAREICQRPHRKATVFLECAGLPAPS